MGAFRSSVRDQLQAKERAAKWVIRGRLLQMGREFRARIVTERLSGPPGIFSGKEFGTTGMTKRSLRYKTGVSGAVLSATASIGGHAPAHREKIQFERIFADESRKAIADIQMRLRPILESSRFNLGGIAVSTGGGPLDLVASIPEQIAADAAAVAAGADTRHRRMTIVRQLHKQGRKMKLKAAERKAFVVRRVRTIEGRVKRRARLGGGA